MPKGEFSPWRKTERVSATPSPSPSRSSVIWLALGVPAPARLMNMRMAQPLMPLPSSGLGGALVSATSTSPLGSASIQRGWSKPSAKAATDRPFAAVGPAVPDGHPLAGATLTVGISVALGGGSSGLGPVPAATGSVADSPQPDRMAAQAARARRVAEPVEE